MTDNEIQIDQLPNTEGQPATRSSSGGGACRFVDYQQSIRKILCRDIQELKRSITMLSCGEINEI